MKKSIIILSSLFLTTIMQAQDRTQPVAGPAPAINIKKPQSFSLPNGLKVLVVENHKLPRVSFNLSLDNLPYLEADKKGVDDLMGALIGNGSVKITKDAFNEEIDFLGADLNFYSSGASGSCLSKYSGRVLELLAEGALNPNFTQEEFDKEKDKIIEGLKADEKSVASTANRVQNVLAFGKNHPNGEFLSETTLKNVTLTDVITNYSTHFNPNNAYLVVVGDIKYEETKLAVEKLFGSWAKSTTSISESYPDPRNAQYTQINFVDMPNAVQSELSLQNTVNLKMGDKDYFAAIIANQILGGDFNSYLNMNLREKHAWTYGARSSIVGNKYVTAFKATTQIRNTVTDSAVVEALKEFKKIRTEKVSDEVLANVKAGYIGKFVMQIEKPQTVAGYALKIKTQELPEDFYENYIKNINAVTADDVLAAAQKYFLEDNLRIVIVGKGVDVVPALEKLKIPMFYFDKNGVKTEKPLLRKEAPKGMTVRKVMDAYIAAVGGVMPVRNIKSLATTATGDIQGNAIEFNTKYAAVGLKMVVEMKAMGMTMMKQVISDKTGYQMQQGQKSDIDAVKLAEIKESGMPYCELNLARNLAVTLDGVEAFNGTECYAIKIGNNTLYYDIATGLKIGKTTTQEKDGKKMSQTVMYGDYKEISGVKYPHKMTMQMGPQEIELNITDIKVNERIVPKDFE
jgi:predicted Zn-dependent peptidase